MTKKSPFIKFKYSDSQTMYRVIIIISLVLVQDPCNCFPSVYSPNPLLSLKNQNRRGKPHAAVNTILIFPFVVQHDISVCFLKDLHYSSGNIDILRRVMCRFTQSLYYLFIIFASVVVFQMTYFYILFIIMKTSYGIFYFA